MEPMSMSEMERGETDLSSFAMLLLKSSNGGSPRDVAGGMLDDDDDDDGSSSDIVTPTSSSTPSRSIRNFFRKRHKSVTIGPDCTSNSSRRSSGDSKESSPSSSAPGTKVRSLPPGVVRPRSKSDLTAAFNSAGGGGRPISAQPRSYQCSYSMQSEMQSETASDILMELDSEGRRSRGSGDSGLPASLQNVYRTPVHSSSSSTAVSVPGSSSASSSRVKWHRSCSVRETAPIGPSEFVELYRSRAYSDPRQQDRQAALAARRRRTLSMNSKCQPMSPGSSWSGVGEFEPRQVIIWKDQQSGTHIFRLPSTHEEEYLDFSSFNKFDDLVFLRFLKSHSCYDVLPTSSKVVVLDTQLNVKKAFFALVDNCVRAVPLWDTTAQNVVGMFTVTDFIRILLKYHSSSQFAMEDIEGHTIAEWSDLLADIDPRPLLSINPDMTMLEAIRKLCLHHVHRLPVIDPESGNLLCLLTHKRLLNYLYEFFQHYGLRHPPYMDKSLDELGIGSFGRIATVRKDTSLVVVLELFMSRRVSSLPIVDSHGHFINVFSKADVMGLALQKSYTNLSNTLEQALGDQVLNGKNSARMASLTCLQSESLIAIVERIVKNRLNRLVVVDNDGHVEGVVSLSDILRRLVLSSADDDSQTENSDVASTFCDVVEV